MADGMKNHDPFASILKFCQPTPSQVLILRTCPFHLDSEDFPDPDPFPLPCSGTRTDQPSAPTPTPLPQHKHTFQTPPPEHQNPTQVCAQCARAIDSASSGDLWNQEVKGFDKPRVLDRRSLEVAVTPVTGTTVAADIIYLSSGDSDEESQDTTTKGDIDDDDDDDVVVEVGFVKKTNAFMNVQRAPIIDVIDGNHELGTTMRDEPTGDSITAVKGKMSRLSTNISSDNGDEIVNPGYLVCHKLGKVARESITEGMSKDGNRDGGLIVACRRIKDIYKLLYSDLDDAVGKRKPREPDICMPCKRKRELPATMKDTVENKGVLIRDKEQNHGRSILIGKEDMTMRSGGLNQGKENNERTNVTRKGEMRNDELNNGKEKDERGGNVVRKVGTESDCLNKGMEGRSNVVGKVDTRSSGLIRGKEKITRSTNAAGMIETKFDRSNEGQAKNVGGMVETESGKPNKGKEKIDRGSNVAGKPEVVSDLPNDETEKNEGGRNVVGQLKEKASLLELIGILKTIVKNVNDDKESDEPVDFVETAKKRGMKFPHPRWRSEGEKSDIFDWEGLGY